MGGSEAAEVLVVVLYIWVGQRQQKCCSGPCTYGWVRGSRSACSGPVHKDRTEAAEVL